MSKSRQQQKRKVRKQAASIEAAAVKPAKQVPWSAILLGTTAVLILAALLGHSVLANARLSVKPVEYRPVSFSSVSASDENIEARYTYDGLDNITSITAVNPTTSDQVTRFLYEDPYNARLLTSVIYPDSSDTTSAGTDQVKISYFLDENIKTITDQNGTVRTFSYDPQRRLAAETITTLGAGVDGTVHKVARTYNWFGSLERITSLDVSNNVLNEVMYTYDNNQRLLRIYQAHEGAVNTTTTPYIEYGYHALVPGRLVSVTYPGGKLLTYTYDGLGRIISISEGSQTLVSYGIDGPGRMLQVTYDEPGLSLDYMNGGKERFGRIADHAWKKSGVDVVRIRHDYDFAGNRLNRRDMVNLAESELYTYDQINQIAALFRGTLNIDGTAVTAQSFSEEWQHDKTGNWTWYDRNGTTENRTHNAANEIQTICVHDANGNTTVMPGLKAKYDAWNRIVEVRDSSDNLIANYAYNGINQRIKQTIGSTVTKSFFNEKWQELESHTGLAATTYVWGQRYIDDLVCRDRDSERLYSLADPNWNVVAVADATGAIQERYAYDGFGKRRIFDASFTPQSTSAYAWNRAFTGQVFDSHSGLMLFRERYLLPTVGRFTSRDPIGYDAEDMNLYRYVKNMPPIHVDPDGQVIPPIVLDPDGNPYPQGPPSWWPWWLPDGYDMSDLVCPLGTVPRKIAANGICKTICELIPCKKLTGAALESAQKAKRALSQKNSAFSKWFHKEYKPGSKTPGINRSNPDLCDSELAEAWDIFSAGGTNNPK